MLSSYLGRAATIVIFSTIVLLAVASIFIKGEDAAHSPINIGVCAFDSTRTWYVFNAFSSYIISRGGGDVRWSYFTPDEKASGCDLYLMTSLQAADYLRNGEMRCALIVARERGRRYSRGLVLARKGEGSGKKNYRVIFDSPISTSGFAAAYKAMVQRGMIDDDESRVMNFADMFSCAEKAFYGVLYGAFDLGCIPEWDFKRLAASGLIDTNRVDVVLKSDPVIELIITVDRDADSRKVDRFIDRLLAMYQALPPTLEAQLASIGISQLIPPRDADGRWIETFSAPLHIEN